MKNKLFIWLFIVLFLSSCSWNKNNLGKIDSKPNSWTWVVKILSGNKVELKKDVNKSKKISMETLSEFDKEVIKLAVTWKIETCKKLSSEKQSYCKDFVKKEQENYKQWNCDKLVYLKQKCLDDKNLKERNCTKISDELKKRQCYFQKEYDKAIKNKDVNFCKTLPRMMKNDCFEKMK